MELNNYLEQHKSIQEEINLIKDLTSEPNVEEHARDIAMHVSVLAGKIKYHLSMEDQYLYPKLHTSGNDQVKNLTDSFQSEMGGLGSSFVAYKNQYNTAPKIVQNQETLKSNTLEILGAIEKRIQKEEKELYKFI